MRINVKIVSLYNITAMVLARTGIKGHSCPAHARFFLLSVAFL
jgi:hypothetical protein